LSPSNHEYERRKFLNNLSRWAAAGAALFAIPACESGADILESAFEEDDRGMYGPIKQAERWLKRDLATDSVPLFHPFDNGQPFLDRWALGHVTRGDQDQLVLVLIDLQTGGHAEVEIYGYAKGPLPVAESVRYGFHINDGGHGDQITPRHLRRLCARLARIVSKNELDVALDVHPPTLREAAAIREQQWRLGDIQYPLDATD
jgi:hypothetical protein